MSFFSTSNRFLARYTNLKSHSDTTMHVHSYRISIDITAPAEDTKAADIVGANTKTQNTALSNFCLTMAIAPLLDYTTSFCKYEHRNAIYTLFHCYGRRSASKRPWIAPERAVNSYASRQRFGLSLLLRRLVTQFFFCRDGGNHSFINLRFRMNEHHADRFDRLDILRRA